MAPTRRRPRLSPSVIKSPSPSPPPLYISQAYDPLPFEGLVKSLWPDRKKSLRCLIEKLPDDVLLEIVDFCISYADEERYQIQMMEAWLTLVHVCRRWRTVVFGSPRRLNLRLLCTPRNVTRDMLGIWPAFPLILRAAGLGEEVVDNVVAVLERSDRVNEIEFSIDGGVTVKLDKVIRTMQKPFPELIYLDIASFRGPEPLPDTFLGGSAPRLRNLKLAGFPFPGLPKLLSSTTHLVELDLQNVTHFAYFPPEAIVTAALSTSKSLRILRLSFISPQSGPDPASRRPPPPIHSVFPVLTELSFKGVSEYLEDLVACIDIPQLNDLDITLFNQIVFDTPQLIQLIRRTPKLGGLEIARLLFTHGGSSVMLFPRTSSYKGFEVEILCMEPDWQVSSMEQVCTSCSPLLSTLEELCIEDEGAKWKDNIENTLWLELLQPFATVKRLFLAENIALRIMPALQELVGGRTMEVLPTLQNIFLAGRWPSGPVKEGTRCFSTSRQVASHPIVIGCWEKDDDDYPLQPRNYRDYDPLFEHKLRHNPPSPLSYSHALKNLIETTTGPRYY